MRSKKITMSYTLAIKNFVSLSDDELIKILELRNSERVRNNMANSEIISLDSHLSFCRSLKNRKDIFYFGVYVNSSLEGVLDLKFFDNDKLSYESGSYFIEKSKYNISYYANLAGFIIAKSMGLKRVTCYVLKDNLQAMLLNTCKLKYKITHSDEKYYYLEKSLDDDVIHTEVLSKLISKRFSLMLDI